MDIIGYDFDNTVYRGDSSTHFTFWCLGHFPKTWLHLPAIVFWGTLFGLRICTKTRFKSHLFGYLRHVKDMDKAVADFWKGHRKNLKGWYLKKDHSRDVIISASPEFLLAPVFETLPVQKLMGTPMDKHTGVIHGENCWGPEKVRRLREYAPDFHMLEFYSDSRSDTPLAQVSDKAFLVKGDEILPW